jgi:tyrosine phenol-lyase
MIIRLSSGKEIPVEMHKIKFVQKVSLPSVDERLKAIEKGGYNTFSLRTRDIFIDMLTDSGTNAMSDNQLGAMMLADNAYAGCESFYKLESAVKEVLGLRYLLPTHQGRASEHLIAKVFIKPGDVIPMNYHFTTTKAHFVLAGGKILEIYADEALQTESTNPFKGNLDIQKLKDVIKKYGKDKIPFVRMEATTNLLGGQPFSMENLKEIREICNEHGIPLLMDATLVSENSYFVKMREKGYENRSIGEIIKETVGLTDIIYMSARKNSSGRGGLIATNNKEYYEMIKPWLPLYEGFLTYGGISFEQMEAIAVGLREMTDISVAGAVPEQVKFFVGRCVEEKIPVVTPAGGLACHVDAKMFLPDLPQSQYPAGALSAAIYIASGVRCMERGTVSMDRDEDGNEQFSDLELARLAVPRRVYTMSHLEYVVDRLKWLYQHRDKIKGLKFVEEPPVLRFFFGMLEPLDNWGAKLAEAFKKDFGTSA